MKKQFCISILLLAYGCSAVAVKPKLQRAHVQQNTKNHTSQTASTDDLSAEALAKEDEHGNENDVTVETPKKSTVLDSWRKVINPYRWGSFSRDDAWNIVGTVTCVGIGYYLFSRTHPTGPHGPNNNNQPPHDPQDPFAGLTPEELQEQQDALNAIEQNRRQQEDPFAEFHDWFNREYEAQQREQEVQRQEEIRQQAERNRQLQQQEQDDLQFAQDLERQLEREENEQQLREREALQRQRQQRPNQFAQWMAERERQRQQQEEDELAEAIRQSQEMENARNNNAPVVVNNAAAEDNQNLDNQGADAVVDPAQERDCDLCGETKNAHEYTEMPCCQYSVCTACLMDYLATRLDNNSTAEVRCPNRACTSAKIEQHTMRAITVTNEALFDRYLVIEFNEYLLQQPQAKQCPTADCPFRFIPFDENVPDSVVCRRCQNRYCSHCLHDHDVERITCEQARIERERETNPDLAAQADLEWMANNTKQCNRCGNAVERNQGCNHMTCKCGYEFCYVCGRPWGNRQTCPYYNHPPV